MSLTPQVKFEADQARWNQYVAKLAALKGKSAEETFRSYLRGLVTEALQHIIPRLERYGAIAIRQDVAAAYWSAKRAAKLLTKWRRRAFVAAMQQGRFDHARWHLREDRTKNADARRFVRSGVGAFDQGRALEAAMKASGWRRMALQRAGPVRIVPDAAEVQMWLKAKLLHVGKMKSGMVPAMRLLGLAVPLWLARHTGAMGGVTAQLRGSNLSFHAWTRAYAPELVEHFERGFRIAFAIKSHGLRKEFHDHLLRLAAGLNRG